MDAASRLSAAAADLAAGRSLDPADAELVARALRRFTQRDDFAGFTRSESIRARDAALRELAAMLGLSTTRARARRIEELAQRYERGRWRHDQHRAANPYQPGTVDALLWTAFCGAGTVPKLRQLQGIIE